jgi:peptidoglycan/xylan/chitin deacetylase (PgdA/CDA1 family)
MKRVYSRAIWNFGRSKKEIYLTFDDGPIPDLTEWVLDELKKFQVPATFFCVGQNIRRHPHIFARVQNEGHRVGNHTMNHVKGFKTPVTEYLKEVDDCRELVQNDLFRPPYGQMRRSQYKGLLRKGFRIVMWDVISYDYEPIKPAVCLRNVVSHTRSGSIVLFHDNLKAAENLKYTLPLFLSHFLQRGFTFRTL